MMFSNFSSDGHLPAVTRQVPASPDSNRHVLPTDELGNTMPQHRPARHAAAAARTRTAVLLARLALAGISLAALLQVGHMYYTH